MRNLVGFVTLVGLAGIAPAQQHRAQSVDVKVLSTMLADTQRHRRVGLLGAGCRGRASHPVRYRRAAGPVLNNARELKVDLTNRARRDPDPQSRRSHRGAHHAAAVRCATKNPAALAVTHVGEGIFFKRDGSGTRLGADGAGACEVRRAGREDDRARQADGTVPGSVDYGPVARVYPGDGTSASVPGQRCRCRMDRWSKTRFPRTCRW